MVEINTELKARLQAFQNATGLTEEQLINVGDDRPPYPEGFETFLEEEGISLENHRQEILDKSLDSLLTDDSIEAIKTLKEKVGFSTDEIATMLDSTFDEGKDLLETMTSNRNLRDLQLLTQVADVLTSEIVDLLKGQNAESRYNTIEYGGLNPLLLERFPNADWSKHEDVDTTELAFDDPILLDIVGKPSKSGFTEQLVEREDGKNDEVSR